MKTLLIGSALALALMAGNPADAADIVPGPAVAAPVPVRAYKWAGFYIGVNAGYGWNRDHGPLECVTPAGVSFGAGCGLIPFNGLNASGFIGGGQAGYNLPLGPFVFGVETDFQGSGIQGSTRTNGPWPFVGLTNLSPSASYFIASQRMDWFGTARLRVGYAVFDRLLVYATGGLAYGRFELSTDVVYPTNSYPASGDVTKAGWTGGGGVEYAPFRHVTVKLEGLYYDFGRDSISGPSVEVSTGFIRGKEFDLRGAIIRAGVNYIFN
jgi:outer membrane immunogenic protein